VGNGLPVESTTLIVAPLIGMAVEVATVPEMLPGGIGTSAKLIPAEVCWVITVTETDRLVW